MKFEEISQFIENMPDEVVEHLTLAMPWQAYETRRVDPDGKPAAKGYDDEDLSASSLKALQEECWKKFNRNPHINTSVRGTVGRLTGLGFKTTSEIFEIQEVLTEVEHDPRNRLYDAWPKNVGRSSIEGELFLCCTCHEDGFIEVDFTDPSMISDGGTGDSGIVFHPRKRLMPIFYNVGTGTDVQQIPSIFVARYPSLVNDIKESLLKLDAQKASKSPSKKFESIGGFNQFIISWNRGYHTPRATSYLRTTIEWINHYENLKKYEIDHKKALGAYAWIFEFAKEDKAGFKRWLALSDAEREKTGLMAKMVPGTRLFLPPGMTATPKSPNLPKISDSDTDILELISSGVNETVDVMTGAGKSNFSAAKASHGPMTDRISDEIALFDRFLKFDFWGNIFFLKSEIAGFHKFFKVEEATGFKKGKPVYENVKRAPEFLIDVDYPTSATVDYNNMMRAAAGSKHPGMSESMGVSRAKVAELVGIRSYGSERKRKATEDKRYPKTLYSFDALDAESVQEKVGGEKKKPSGGKDKKKKTNDDNGEE